MSEMKDCPHCGAEDSLETYLRIDLDEVVLGEPNMQGYRSVIRFVPAYSANDPDTGLVTEEATVSCRECGREIDAAHVPMAIMKHWSYHE